MRTGVRRPQRTTLAVEIGGGIGARAGMRATDRGVAERLRLGCRAEFTDAFIGLYCAISAADQAADTRSEQEPESFHHCTCTAHERHRGRAVPPMGLGHGRSALCRALVSRHHTKAPPPPFWRRRYRAQWFGFRELPPRASVRFPVPSGRLGCRPDSTNLSSADLANEDVVQPIAPLVVGEPIALRVASSVAD